MATLVPLSDRQKVRHHKVVVRWSDIHKAKGSFNFSYYDKEIKKRLADGSQSLLLLLQGPTPEWARDPAYGAFAHNAPPRDMGDWYAFCSQVAERYGSVVDFYEIWNEPGWDRDGYAYSQYGVYHFGGQVETDYLPMLQTAHAAIKEKDPTGAVMCGALICTLDPNPNTGAELTLQLYDEVNRPGQDISLEVTAAQPIVAERPMYFDYQGKWDGGHDVVGATAAAKQWFFAEGTTRAGFEEWLCLQNPNPAPIQVTATYMFGPGQGENRVQGYELQPDSRTTLMVNSEVGQEKDVSVKLASSADFIAERPMYFSYGPGAWTGGHDVVGATAAAKQWFFAEGTTRAGFEEWLCLQNPNPAPIQVTATYMFGPGQGENRVQGYELQPDSRTTLMVNSEVGQEKDVSVKLASSADFIAERPMYFSYGPGAWTGGHDVVGATAAAKQWFFAEGCTGYSIQQYLCLQNPQAAAVAVELKFMMTKGEVLRRTISLPPNSRTTLDINTLIGFHGSSDMIASHPYKNYWHWGEHYAYLTQTLRAHNIPHEVAVTEVGTPHYSDDQPGLYNEGMQAEAIGSVGVGGLFGAGCRKIWIYRDIDENLGTSWDHVYYGLFKYTGEPTLPGTSMRSGRTSFPAIPTCPRACDGAGRARRGADRADVPLEGR